MYLALSGGTSLVLGARSRSGEVGRDTAGILKFQSMGGSGVPSPLLVSLPSLKRGQRGVSSRSSPAPLLSLASPRPFQSLSLEEFCGIQLVEFRKSTGFGIKKNKK